MTCSHICVVSETKFGSVLTARCICPDQYEQNSEGACKYSPGVEGPIKISPNHMDTLCEVDMACSDKGRCEVTSEKISCK